jgi:hypothetical protein
MALHLVRFDGVLQFAIRAQQAAAVGAEAVAVNQKNRDNTRMMLVRRRALSASSRISAVIRAAVWAQSPKRTSVSAKAVLVCTGNESGFQPTSPPMFNDLAAIQRAREPENLLLKGLFCRALLPLNAGTPFLQSAVSQKQVDEILIRHTQFRRHLLEVRHCYGIEADGDLTLSCVA